MIFAQDDTSKFEPATSKGSVREKRSQPLQRPSRIRHPEDTSIYSHCEAKPRPGKYCSFLLQFVYEIAIAPLSQLQICNHFLWFLHVFSYLKIHETK